MSITPLDPPGVTPPRSLCRGPENRAQGDPLCRLWSWLCNWWFSLVSNLLKASFKLAGLGETAQLCRCGLQGPLLMTVPDGCPLP